MLQHPSSGFPTNVPRPSRRFALVVLAGSVQAQTPLSGVRQASTVAVSPAAKSGAAASGGSATALAKFAGGASNPRQAPAAPSATSTVAPLIGDSDNPALADPIRGFGNFAVDTTTATGTISNGVCAAPNNDVGFVWIATAKGRKQASFCGLTGVDTVVAVWNSGVCPPTSLAACNDDFCNVQSQVQFAAVSGTT